MQKSKTILALDDDRDILNILERVLKNAGFQVLLAQTSVEARQMMNDFLPHLILTDLNMAPESGQNFIRSIRKKRDYDDIPIIVLSAINEFAEVKEVMSLGIADYAVKPIHPQTILRKVKKALLHQDFLRKEVVPNAKSKVTIKLDAQVIALDDVGLELKGSFKLTGSEKIQLTSSELNGEFLISDKMKTYVSSGVFINEVKRNAK